VVGVFNLQPHDMLQHILMQQTHTGWEHSETQFGASETQVTCFSPS
jgi:hypothetical protein